MTIPITGATEVEDWFLTLLRNNITDPLNRGEDSVFNGFYSVSNTFTLPKPKVQNIQSVTLNSVPLRWGYDYTYVYGEGTLNPTTVTLLGTLTFGDAVQINYHNGLDSEKKLKDGQTIIGGGMIDKGFFRADNTRPKITLLMDNAAYENIGIGPLTSKWKTHYFNVEIFSQFATQAKGLANLVENMVMKNNIPPLYPHYHLLEMRVDSIENFDYQAEFRSYMYVVKVAVITREFFA